VQQPVDGDQLFAFPAGPERNVQERVALRPGTDARTGCGAGRDRTVFQPDVLGELQRTVFPGRIRGERSTGHGGTIRELVRVIYDERSDKKF